MTRRTSRALGAGLFTLLLAAAPTPGRSEAQSAPAFRVGFTLNEDHLAPLALNLTAQAPAGWRVVWDFGDGGGGEGQQLTHTYYRPGTYTLRAQLLEPGGQVRSVASRTLEVRSSGPERARLVVLLGRGEVRLSAAGSVVYRPFTPQFTLNGRAVGNGPVPLPAGQVRAAVQLSGTSGPLRDQVTFTPAPLAASAAFEAEVVRLTNQARTRGWNCQTGREDGPARSPLASDPRLAVAALAQSAGMALAGYFAHESGLDGSTPAQRVEAAGLDARSSGENIAAGQRTPEEVVAGWLRSEGHCRNIMGEYTRIGVAYVGRADSAYRHYWTQVFATPAGETAVPAAAARPE